MQDDPEFNIRFVGIIEGKPCLYDITHKDYHMNYAQEKAWTEVTNEIGGGVTIQDCKTRWRNLRGRFSKSLKQKTPSGSGFAPKKTYYLTEYMNFLTPFTKSRPSKGNIPLPSKESQKTSRDSDDNESDYSTGVIGEEYLDEAEEFSQVSKEVTDNIEELLEMPSTSTKRPSSAHATQGSKKKRQAESTKITIDDVNQSAFNYFTQRTGKQLDSDTHFLMSLSSDMSRMTESQKRQFKINVLTEAGNILGEEVSFADQQSTSQD